MTSEQFRNFADPFPEPMLLVSGDWIVVSCNRAALERLGVRPDRLLGRALRELVAEPAEDVEHYLETCGRSRDMTAGALTVTSESGQQTPCRAHGALLRPRDEDSPGLVLLRLLPKNCEADRLRDLDPQASEGAEVAEEVDRKRLAEKTALAQFQQLADALPQIVWTARPDGFIDFYNERWYEYTGFPRGEYGDQSWQPILHPGDVRRCLDTYYSCVRSGKLYQIEYRFKDRSTGGYRWFLGRAYPVRDDRGNVVRWFGTCTDVDDTKRAAESLLESDRRKDEFLATLAHELRNPLAPIYNGLQLMRLAGDNPEVMVQAREMMERQVGQMIRMVDDLLDLSRMTRNRLELRMQQVELAAVVQSAAEVSRPLIDENRHELVVSLPVEPVFLTADLARLSQVFSNLLNNSAKYTPPGGRVLLTAENNDGEVWVTVSDNGIGIPSSMLPRIFEMFTRADQSLENTKRGLGIGLSLVKRLVEMHHGKIEAESAGPGRGSTFRVRLPILGAASVAARPDPQAGLRAPRAPRAPKRRVLVADDNEDIVTSFGMMLSLMGNEVRTVQDGTAALETAETFRPEVILLDIGMPKLNGYDTARMIRERPWGKDVVLVALTGWAQDEDRRRSKMAGFDFHLTKPVDSATLEKLLIESKPPDPGPSVG